MNAASVEQVAMASLPDLLQTLNNYITDDIIPTHVKIPSNISYILEQSILSIKSKERDSSSFKRIESVLDMLWEHLNTGHWKDVPEVHRKLYSLFSLIKIITLIKEKLDQPTQILDTLKEAIKTADLGLLLGCDQRHELSQAATLINKMIHNEMHQKETSSLSIQTTSDFSNFDNTVYEMISVMKCPSLEYFNKHHFKPELPVKLTYCITHWPALTKWCDINYIKSVAAFRTVPVELGSSYTHEDWGMKLLTMDEFISNYIYSKSDKIGYLAQHQLFHQIPELKKDIYIPEYCCVSNEENSMEEPDINAWFGPGGTITPLHFDPKHNLLSQVIGRKQIILYSPEDTGNLYPHESEMLHNTARVDPEKPDYKQFPRFKLAKGYECLLNPGEMLYIPPKWWHYVRSLDVSFSVSFWWT